MPLFTDTEEIMEKLDALEDLSTNIQAYRRSRDFYELMQFITKFRRYSPYNAFLLHVQNPKVSFVATPSVWRKEFHRKIKPEARTLLILAPMHPILFVYDLADTEGAPIPNGLIDPFATEGQIDEDDLEDIIHAARKDGILLDLSTKFSNLHAGTARRLEHPLSGEEGEKMIDFHFMITINADLDTSAFFATFTHELGHIYCGHLGKTPGAWWPERKVNAEIVEFEAEAVSYLVCKRCGLQTKSGQYLALKAEQDIELPAISLDTILKVASRIEKMGKKQSGGETLHANPR